MASSLRLRLWPDPGSRASLQRSPSWKPLHRETTVMRGDTGSPHLSRPIRSLRCSASI